MVLARVVGTVVSTSKVPQLGGVRFLLVERLDVTTMKGTGDHVVAMDSVGAGPGEVVFFVAGSSSRLTPATEGRPADATITAIVDEIELNGSTRYRKGES